MSTLNQVRDGLSRAWETVTDGWRDLVERAGDALTRFHPPRPTGDTPAPAGELAWRGARWGVLAAEVTADHDEIEVQMEVPGMDPDDFEIEVIGDTLVVRGEKRVEHERKHGQYHVMERAYGSFERAVRLPAQVDESATRASYKHGVLKIILARSERSKVRRITVHSH